MTHVTYFALVTHFRAFASFPNHHLCLQSILQSDIFFLYPSMLENEGFEN
jgi:hypothetical protein